MNVALVFSSWISIPFIGFGACSLPGDALAAAHPFFFYGRFSPRQNPSFFLLSPKKVLPPQSDPPFEEPR